MLYIMHVPWGWLKQRPHFLAEELARRFDVTVLYKIPFRKSAVRNDTTLKLKYLWRLPLDRFRFVDRLNSILYRLQARILCRRYDIFWFTAPTYAAYFLPYIPSGAEVIYDCMDDMLEFDYDSREKERIRRNEEALVRRANIVFVTSDYLKSKLESRYGRNDLTVVNNAIHLYDGKLSDDPELPQNVLSFRSASGRVKISYIGTVSLWMDYGLMEYVSSQEKGVEFYIWGPVSTAPSTQCPEIHFCGSVEHRHVFDVMAASDILIMPFELNELILSVNPVKLYEYVSSGKLCLAPRYGETEKFRPYVRLYSGPEECLDIVRKFISGEVAPCGAEDCAAFARANTWERRADRICAVLAGENQKI